jgi:predicted nuclease of predicted toxin-antitoxin system
LLARHLSAVGQDAVHVADVGLLKARDVEIWRHAAESRAVLVTKDADFVTMRALNPDGPAIVWVRIGNATNQQLVERFRIVWPNLVAALERGESVIEISG